jgi:tetratricopeptide (TPR) repeat protein
MRLGIGRSSASMLLSLALFSAPRPAASQTAPSNDVTELRRQATVRFEEGAAAFREKRYEDAVRAFLAADQLLPSPVLSFNVARAYESVGDAAGALAFYQDYLRRDPAPTHGEAVRERVAAFSATLLARGGALLTLLSEPPGATLIVDGRALARTPWAGTLVPGRHRLTVTKQGMRDESREVELVAGQALELTVALVPGSAVDGAPKSAPEAPSPAAPEASSRRSLSAPRARARRDVFAPWSFVGLGAGAAALALAGGFELARRSAETDARDADTQIAYADRYDAMRARQTTARVFAATGGALLLLGGTLVVLDVTRESEGSTRAAFGFDGQSCLGTLAGSF